MKNRNLLFTTLIAFVLVLSMKAQSPPSIQWQKCFGGSSDDNAMVSVQQTSDGGYIMTGSTFSNDGDISGNHGGVDCWVAKLDNAGSIQWKKCFGGSNGESPAAIHQTNDGGYVFAANVGSNDGDVSGNHGGGDCWIVKLDNTGSMDWQKCYGGSSTDVVRSIKQTIDGGYILAGSTQSNDGDVSGIHGITNPLDYWVVKVDSSGTMQWQKCLGGSTMDEAWDIYPTNDGGYIMAGNSYSNDGDVSGNHGLGTGLNDYWIVKMDSSGSIQWQKCLGGTGNDEANSIQQTTDGGYIIAGVTKSNDGDVSGFHNPGSGFYDLWVVKVDSLGTLQWQSCLGGSMNEVTFSIKQTNDGGYILSSYSLSNDGDVSGNHSLAYDYWIVKLNSSGTIDWQKCLGGTGSDLATYINETNDGGFIVGGVTDSNNGDVSGNHGGLYDLWIVKLSGTTTNVESEEKLFNSTIFPNPMKDNLSIKVDVSFIGKDYNIFDQNGKVVLTGKLSSEQIIIATNSLSNGLYTLSIDGQNNQAIKIIKE